MPYWELYYHLVWTTKDREPLITAKLEPELHRYLRGKGLALGGVVHAVGGVEDHIHMVASIPPGIAVATFIGQIKGASAHWVNHLAEHPAPFHWQDGYGAISFGKRALPQLVDYVLHQKEHHSNRQVIQLLERAERET